MKKMKLLCKIEVSDKLSKLFETSKKLSDAWNTFLCIERSEIDCWIAFNGDFVQRWLNSCNQENHKKLSENEMNKIVHFTIQSFALEEGLATYLEDPTHRTLEDEVVKYLEAMKFLDDALRFCNKRFGIIVQE